VVAYRALGCFRPNGAGQSIGPNETLIFEIELLAVKAAGAK